MKQINYMLTLFFIFFSSQASADLSEDKTEKEAIEAFLKAEKEFKSSPDGKLITAYQYIQILQTCSDIRKGYAIVHISDEELKNAKKQVISVESRLKKSIKEKNTDVLWQKAAKRNTNFDISSLGFWTIDIIDSIKNKPLSGARDDCNKFKNKLYYLTEEIVGKEVPKKNF